MSVFNEVGCEGDTLSLLSVRIAPNVEGRPETRKREENHTAFHRGQSSTSLKHPTWTIDLGHAGMVRQTSRITSNLAKKDYGILTWSIGRTDAITKIALYECHIAG